MAPDRSSRYLTADEVGVRLEVSARRVRMIPAAELPYLVLVEGGPRRYTPADVEVYVRRRTIRR